MTTSSTTPVSTAGTQPSKRRRKPGRRVLIPCVEWETYEQLLKAFEKKRNVRLTYDRGDLEIMVPSFEHEDDADFLAVLVALLAKGLGLPIHRGGSTTLKRKKWKKGLEPDRCFWIASAPKLAGVRQLDLRIHPPPDLAIEVDVTHSSLERSKIYAKLGVTELWRLDGDDLKFHVLGAQKKYAEVASSTTFAGIAPADLMIFVKQGRGIGDQSVVENAFELWLRQRIAVARPTLPLRPPPTAP